MPVPPEASEIPEAEAPEMSEMPVPVPPEASEMPVPVPPEASEMPVPVPPEAPAPLFEGDVPVLVLVDGRTTQREACHICLYAGSVDRALWPRCHASALQALDYVVGTSESGVRVVTGVDENDPSQVVSTTAVVDPGSPVNLLMFVKNEDVQQKLGNLRLWKNDGHAAGGPTYMAPYDPVIRKVRRTFGSLRAKYTEVPGQSVSCCTLSLVRKRQRSEHDSSAADAQQSAAKSRRTSAGGHGEPRQVQVLLHEVAEALTAVAPLLLRIQQAQTDQQQQQQQPLAVAADTLPAGAQQQQQQQLLAAAADTVLVAGDRLARDGDEQQPQLFAAAADTLAPAGTLLAAAGDRLAGYEGEQQQEQEQQQYTAGAADTLSVDALDDGIGQQQLADDEWRGLLHY